MASTEEKLLEYLEDIEQVVREHLDERAFEKCEFPSASIPNLYFKKCDDHLLLIHKGKNGVLKFRTCHTGSLSASPLFKIAYTRPKESSYAYTVNHSFPEGVFGEIHSIAIFSKINQIINLGTLYQNKNRMFLIDKFLDEEKS